MSATAYVEGFLLQASIIVAIGSQNMFVIRQGLRGEGIALAAGICIFCDVTLISLGIVGLAGVLARYPGVLRLFFYLTEAFLVTYAVRSAYYAMSGRKVALRLDAPHRAMGTALTALVVSLFNPHVYLDAVFIIGGYSTKFDASDRTEFAMGATIASVIWFVLLGLGAQILAPALRTRGAWRLIEAITFLVMTYAALSLFSLMP